MKKQISQIELFQKIMPETMEMILREGKVMRFPKGTFLMRAREPVASIYFQLSGKSIVYNLTHAGKRKILFVCGQGVLLNENLLNNRNSSVFCETIESSEIFVIPVAAFTKMMEFDFQLTKNILEAQEKKIWRLGHQLKNTTSCIQLERKLVAKLWKLARDFGFKTEEGIEIDINLSITLLADMLGTSRETTSRICSFLVENGLIKINKKRITIVNSEKMSLFYKNGKIEHL